MCKPTIPNMSSFFYSATLLVGTVLLFSQTIDLRAQAIVNTPEEDTSEVVVEKKNFTQLKIARFSTDTFHGKSALGDVTGFDIWTSLSRNNIIGYSIAVVRPKFIYNLGFTQSRLSFNDIPRRFGIPPNLPDLSRNESITFVNMNLGVDYVFPREPIDKLALAFGPTLVGARYMYTNENRNYATVGFGAQANYRIGLFYFGMEYRAMILNPEYFKNFFRWEVGLWFDL